MSRLVILQIAHTWIATMEEQELDQVHSGRVGRQGSGHVQRRVPMSLQVWKRKDNVEETVRVM